jgi:hypothetical protein
MSEKATQPLYSGGNPSFPLSSSPYYSRTEDKNVRFLSEDELSNRKNYQFVAFRPGFSLQASELNEMQENMQMQMSLSITMMHNWITSGSGYLWSGWDVDSPVGEGDKWNGDTSDLPPNTGIGVGGDLTSAGSPFHDQNWVVSGPGWKGATPLYPFKSPYQGDGGKKLVEVIKFTDTEATIKFNPGWYLVEARAWWNGTLSEQPPHVSGLKHWVYLDDNTIGDGGEISVGYSTETKSIVVGLVVDSEFMECCSGVDGCDDTLADNASGFPNSASCGASRYRLSITEATHVFCQDDNWGDEDNESSDFADRERMNPVCVIRPDDNTIRYINNLVIKTK